MPRTMMALADRVTNESEAYELLEQLRWGTSPVCPHCHDSRVVFIRPMNRESRRTRTGSMSPRRVWKCRECHAVRGLLAVKPDDGDPVDDEDAPAK